MGKASERSVKESPKARRRENQRVMEAKALGRMRKERAFGTGVDKVRRARRLSKEQRLESKPAHVTTVAKLDTLLTTAGRGLRLLRRLEEVEHPHPPQDKWDQHLRRRQQQHQ